VPNAFDKPGYFQHGMYRPGSENAGLDQTLPGNFWSRSWSWLKNRSGSIKLWFLFFKQDLIWNFQVWSWSWLNMWV